jgi:hypothetical protein
MNQFDVVTVPSFSDFVAEVTPTEPSVAVRLVLSERYDPERYGAGERSFSVPAKSITLDLQGFDERGELVWLSRSITVRWGDGEPALAEDQDRYEGMAELARIVRERLEKLGYQVLPGRYLLPKDCLAIGGYFDCAEWYRDQEGHLRVRPAADTESTD